MSKSKSFTLIQKVYKQNLATLALKSDKNSLDRKHVTHIFIFDFSRFFREYVEISFLLWGDQSYSSHLDFITQPLYFKLICKTFSHL
jgi:hypothetical protein